MGDISHDKRAAVLPITLQMIVCRRMPIGSHPIFQESPLALVHASFFLAAARASTRADTTRLTVFVDLTPCMTSRINGCHV